MPQQSYDKVIQEDVAGEKICYGILYGNEKIVFIKTGAGGTIRGYKGKNLQIAHRVYERLGTTVICASNPDAEYEAQTDADKAMISKVAADSGFVDYELYFVGTSDGGYQNLLLAKVVPQTVKFLGINTSPIADRDVTKSLQDFAEKLQALPFVHKLMVYGTKDDAYEECVPGLTDLACENLEVITVDGADHEFRGMLEEYIALIDLL